MNFEIRHFSESDRAEVRSICLSTASQKPRSQSRQLYMHVTQCDYYLDCEPENCFVAVVTDDEGTPHVAGYILCAADCEVYARRYMDKYLPKLKQYGKVTAYFARTDVMVFGRFAAFFPAHIRIAVLPQYRRQGMGRALVEALCAQLSSQRGKGVLAITDKRSAAALAFFPACGFSELQRFGGGVAFGRDL